MPGTRILVVHDDAMFSDRVREAILATIPGAEVYSAVSGMRALGIAKQRHPAVIIADGDLVGMDGFTFTQELKGDADLADIPVIIVVGSPTEATALRARQSGASAHLPSSIDMATLMQKLMSFLPTDISVVTDVASPAPASGEAGGAAGGDQPAAQPSAHGHGVPGPAVDDADRAPGGQVPRVPMAEPAVAASAGRPQPPGSDTPHIDDLLRLMIERGGSDLHVTVGSPPGIRLRGE
ncbi:MAG: response regulator, partial [Coriobacteriales bacterium]